MYDLPLTFWKEQHTPAFVLLSMAIAKYGSECFEWQPEFLRKEIEDDYSLTLSDLAADKLQAAIIILTTDSLENHWEVFETCVHLLNNDPDNFHTFEPLEAEEIAHALPEIEMIKNAEHEPLVFSDEVTAYAGIVFYEYGMHKAPTLFSAAQMPPCVKACDDTEKNEALKEIYDARKKFLLCFVERLRVMHG